VLQEAVLHLKADQLASQSTPQCLHLCLAPGEQAAAVINVIALTLITVLVGLRPGSTCTQRGVQPDGGPQVCQGVKGRQQLCTSALLKSWKAEGA
jgi:hypothetical protein